jgi:hypothetical protein
MDAPFNPWLKVWVEPRATIAYILRESPNRGFWILACIYGFSSALNWFQSMMLGLRIGVLPIFLLALLLSPLWGYVGISVWSWVVHFSGRWLKGEGTFKEVRTAYAWSCVPIVVNVGLWFFLALIFGRALFANFAPESQILTQGEVAILFSILVIRIGVMIWSLVIYLKMLAEVRHYSILRAIGNVLIAGAIVTAALYLIIWIGASLYRT